MIQENGLITGADFGSIPDGFPPFGLAIDGLLHERLKLVHDDLYQALCLVLSEVDDSMVARCHLALHGEQ